MTEPERIIVRSPEVEHAEAEKFLAEAAVARAKAEKEALEVAVGQLQLRAHGIELERQEERRLRELADDFYHRVFRFNGPVDDKNVDSCMATLQMWSRLDGVEKRDITIEFFSPGGNIISGMALFDFIQQMRQEGHRVTTAALGYAASMAGILLQAGDLRVMAKQSWLLIHQGSFGAMGNYGAVKDTLKWVEKIQERILDIFADRAVPEDAPSRATKVKQKRREIKKGWERTDWWLTAEEALAHGFCDEVR